MLGIITFSDEYVNGLKPGYKIDLSYYGMDDIFIDKMEEDDGGFIITDSVDGEEYLLYEVYGGYANISASQMDSEDVWTLCSMILISHTFSAGRFYIKILFDVVINDYGIPSDITQDYDIHEGVTYTDISNYFLKHKHSDGEDLDVTIIDGIVTQIDIFYRP